jgi:hypothetical protein
MNKNRDKGHRFEREIRQFFESLGYDTCKTSRYASKLRDDQKVDHCFVDPWLSQCKHSDSMSGVPHKLLNEMPDEKGMYRILFHKMSRKGTVVTMELDTFKEILEMLIAGGIIKP